jgi:hypothetical protein
MTLSVKSGDSPEVIPPDTRGRPRRYARAMGRGATATLTMLALGAAVSGCGSGTTSATSANHKSPTSIQVVDPPAVDVRHLLTGTPQQQITTTIVTFYRATWQNDRPLACSMFSPAGEKGFIQSAKIAFPYTVNGNFTCEQIMAYFHATLADAVNTLQQAGVNVSGNVLDNVGVQKIVVHGNTATAQAPEQVEELIKPKLFMLVRLDNRWQIEGTKALGKTLPQLLATAKAKGELRAKKQGSPKG